MYPSDEYKVINYWTFKHWDSHSLDLNVQQALSDGWILYGNPYYSKEYYCQAMIGIRKKPTRKPKTKTAKEMKDET